MWVTIAVTALLVVVMFISAQYRSAQRPSSLESIPEYPLVGSSYPFGNLTAQERAQAEETLRQCVSTVVSGYRIVDERFLAAKTARNNFIGDALRSEVNGYLNRESSYEVARTDSHATQNDAFYIAWQHSNPLARRFNRQIIVAAALMNPIRQPEPDNQQIHAYGYFRLVPG